MVTDRNHLDGRPSLSPSHWDDNFKIFYLTDKMRNQKDSVFAALCDRVGNGTYTKNDLLYLEDNTTFHQPKNNVRSLFETEKCIFNMQEYLIVSNKYAL